MHLDPLKLEIESPPYGSLYVTLCFVLFRFEFGVSTFYFRILSFLLCVLCTMLFILNGARTSDTLIGYLPIFQMLPKFSLYIKYRCYSFE